MEDSYSIEETPKDTGVRAGGDPRGDSLLAFSKARRGRRTNRPRSCPIMLPDLVAASPPPSLFAAGARLRGHGRVAWPRRRGRLICSRSQCHLHRVPVSRFGYGVVRLSAGAATTRGRGPGTTSRCALAPQYDKVVATRWDHSGGGSECYGRVGKALWRLCVALCGVTAEHARGSGTDDRRVRVDFDRGK